MKLLSKFTRVSLAISLVIFIIGGFIYFETISYLSDQQLDRDLTEEYGEMINFINQHQRFPKPFEFDSYEAKFKRIGQLSQPNHFIDTVVLAHSGDKTISCRAIIAVIPFKGTNYLMTIVESKEATQTLIQLVFTITLILVILLLLALLITNRILFKKIWQPFYVLLGYLRDFSLTRESKQAFADSSKITEFNELKLAINLMEERAKGEYESLKSFTENASHEMMTPVALINSKLDNLIQDESLNETQLEQLKDVYSASRRLSQLSQSLLLLVKIDNRLMHDIAEVELSTCIENKVKQFEDFLQSKNIEVKLSLSHKTIKGSIYLIDILLSNLFSNAIRHNYKGGEISITLDKERLTVDNTGANELLDSGKIFERFQKSPLSKGTGLGLTIAKNICLSYGYKLEYQFAAPYHRFIVLF
jgi:signal transduction histidine kinase